MESRRGKKSHSSVTISTRLGFPETDFTAIVVLRITKQLSNITLDIKHLFASL